ncbi:DUF3231 family protein [Bacillus sp. 2205SS5-2]|uniref:DUF3231 family protein n=1 Tax=Bacillus sp. 2205SS5-2 TaxID=3109031 RepID=UPI003004821B
METTAKLTSSEIGALWTTYIEASMSTCMLEYFIATCECQQTQDLLKKDLSFKKNNLPQKIQQILLNEQLPTPKGFGKEDINVLAPPLFSDSYILEHLLYSSRLGSANSNTLLVLMSRRDVRDLFTEGVQHFLTIFNETANLLLEKGLYIRPPYVTTQQSVEFISTNDYLGGGGILHELRPLNTIEISHLFMHSQTNTLGLMIMTAFSQVAQNEDVKKHFIKGKELSKKIIQHCSDILSQSEIPSPKTWDANVSDSTIAPFSDKLMLQIVSGLSGFGVAMMGASISATMRTDVQATYFHLLKAISTFAKKGLELMIEHEWLEKPPTAPNRQNLIKSKH